MENINIFVTYAHEKMSIPTQSDIVLEDLLDQLADQGRIPKDETWLVTKAGSAEALALGNTLAENGIGDGSSLFLANSGKAGSI